MRVKTRHLALAMGALIVLGVFSTYQDQQAALESQPAQSTPSASSSQTPVLPPVPASPSPVPTVTITVTAPPSDDCKRAAELASQMKDAVYETSSEFADTSRILDAAIRAMGRGDQADLSKQLKALQDASDEMNPSALRVTELDPQLAKALDRCKNG